MQTDDAIIIVDDDVDDHYFYNKACETLASRPKLIFIEKALDLIPLLTQMPGKPLMIICDINMPILNGLELRRMINQDDTLRRKSIPFIIFSTAASPMQVREAFELGVHGFFLKEQRVDEIRNTLSIIMQYWKKCQQPQEPLS